MRKIHRKIVAAIIYSKDNKLLMGKKNPDEVNTYKNCWHIPGGGIEEGETHEQALIREVQEETGVDVSNYKFEIATKDRGQAKIVTSNGESILKLMRFSAYKISIHDKNSNEIEVIPNDELVELRWFDISELKNVKMTPPSTRYFKKIGYI